MREKKQKRPETKPVSRRHRDLKIGKQEEFTMFAFFLPTVPGTLAMEPDFFLPPSLVGKEKGKWEIFGLDRKTAQ